jgi:uncharacterized cupin superfamily protein
MVAEARLAQTENGLVPESDGWFVLNARDARWTHTDALGSGCTFEGEVPFPELGINVNVLPPGQPMCMYHGENAQEDFLVLSGECLLIIEGEERRLKAWDFVHCPPWTEHVLVGAGTEPCVVLAVGARPEGHGAEVALRYPVSEVALKHGAGVSEETSEGREAYARFPRPTTGRYREGDLP